MNPAVALRPDGWLYLFASLIISGHVLEHLIRTWWWCFVILPMPPPRHPVRASTSNPQQPLSVFVATLLLSLLHHYISLAQVSLRISRSRLEIVDCPRILHECLLDSNPGFKVSLPSKATLL